MHPMSMHEGLFHGPALRPPEGAAGTHVPDVAPARSAKATGAGQPAPPPPRALSLSRSPSPPWPTARALDTVPSGYESSSVPGVFVDRQTGKYFVIKDDKAYSVGFHGGGDTDASLRRQQLEQRKAQTDRRRTELSSLRASLQSEIANESRQRDDASRAVSTRERGKRAAEQLLADLKCKQQQGESNLDREIQTMTTEVRGWETELQRAQHDRDRYLQSVSRLDNTLRSLIAELERVERDHAEVERELQRF